MAQEKTWRTIEACFHTEAWDLSASLNMILHVAREANQGVNILVKQVVDLDLFFSCSMVCLLKGYKIWFWIISLLQYSTYVMLDFYK